MLCRTRHQPRKNWKNNWKSNWKRQLRVWTLMFCLSEWMYFFCRGLTSVMPECGVSAKRLFFFAAGPFLLANNGPVVAHIHSSQSPSSVYGTESSHRWSQSLLDSFASLRAVSSAVQCCRWRRWRCSRIARILLAETTVPWRTLWAAIQSALQHISAVDAQCIFIDWTAVAFVSATSAACTHCSSAFFAFPADQSGSNPGRSGALGRPVR